MSAQLQHSNLYTRGFPPDFSEAELIQLFGEHGSIVSLRVVAAAEGQAPHAFVKYEQPGQVRIANGRASRGRGRTQPAQTLLAGGRGWQGPCPVSLLPPPPREHGGASGAAAHNSASCWVGWSRRRACGAPPPVRQPPVNHPGAAFTSLGVALAHSPRPLAGGGAARRAQEQWHVASCLYRRSRGRASSGSRRPHTLHAAHPSAAPTHRPHRAAGAGGCRHPHAGWLRVLAAAL